VKSLDLRLIAISFFPRSIFRRGPRRGRVRTRRLSRRQQLQKPSNVAGRSPSDSRSKRGASGRYPCSAAKIAVYGSGFIVTNPNCSTAGLVLVLKPLADAFGLEKIFVVTLQASPCGLSGSRVARHSRQLSSRSSGGEEEKMEEEPQKSCLAGGMVRVSLKLALASARTAIAFRSKTGTSNVFP